MTVTTLPRRRKGAGLADCWVTTLVDAYGLPEPERSWIKYRDPDDWLTSQPGVDPAVLMVSLARHVRERAAVALTKDLIRRLDALMERYAPRYDPLAFTQAEMLAAKNEDYVDLALSKGASAARSSSSMSTE